MISMFCGYLVFPPVRTDIPHNPCSCSTQVGKELNRSADDMKPHLDILHDNWYEKADDLKGIPVAVKFLAISYMATQLPHQAQSLFFC